MRIVILKGSAPRHNYFARELSMIKGVDAKIITFNRLDGNRLRKMLKRDLKTFLFRITKHLIAKIRRYEKKEKDYFGDIKLNEEVVYNINDSFTYQTIKNFTPDLIAVFGTPIISNLILDIPKFGTINLHGGISPWYKGGNTIFWPLLKKDFLKIGATIHYAVKQVDSGLMLARIYPEIIETDNELSLSNKTFKEGTKEFCKIIEYIRDNNVAPKGKTQEIKGELFLAKHRTLKVDLLGPKDIRKNLKNVFIQQRIERFYP